MLRSPHVLLACAIVGAIALKPSTAQGRPQPTRKHGTFKANKSFGLGFMIGVPSGLAGKYYIGPNRALDFGIGGIRYYRGRDGLHLHLDHLWHPAVLGKNRDFEVPLYLGVGARFFSFTDGNDSRGGALGLRAPIGVALDFNKVPLDIFFELAFVADLLIDYEDDYYTDVTGALGLRYYFR